MSLLVSTAIDDMQRELNSIGQEADTGDFYWALNRSLNYFLQTYDLPTGKRVTGITLYPSVREYALPSDFVALIPPRKPGAEEVSPVFSMNRERDIYTHLDQKSLAIEFDRGTQYLVAVDDTDAKQMLHSCSSLTGVAVTGDGSNLQLDDRVFVSGSYSISFGVEAVAGSSTVTFDLESPVDISDTYNESTTRGFFDLDVPTDATVTSVVFRVGNDASNYYEWTKTVRFRGNAITGGWGKIGAAFEQMALLTEDGDTLLTEDGDTLLREGNADLSAIDWIQIIVNHGTTNADGTYRIDSIFLTRGKYYELPYYTNAVVQDEDGTYKALVDSMEDTLLLPPTSEGAIEYKALELLAAVRLKDDGLANYFARELVTYESGIKSKFPKQSMLRQTTWYRSSKRF